MSIANVCITSRGSIVELTDSEIKACQEASANGTKYKYFTRGEYSVEFTLKRNEVITCRVVVPAGFLTDGNSGGPDYGISWLFHDWLYAVHAVMDTDHNAEISCTREDADDLMSAIMEQEAEREDTRIEGMFASWYEWGFSVVSRWNMFGLFGRAWLRSGKRGAEFAEDIGSDWDTD
jgi:hypothetical protein